MRRLILGAVLVAAALLAWLLLSDTSAPTDLDSARLVTATPTGMRRTWEPDADAARPSVAVVPVEESRPELIARGEASLQLVLPAGVLVLAPARIQLMRASDGWTDARFVYTGDGTTWRGLQPGAYQLTPLDHEFTPEASEVLLQGGDERSIILEPRRIVRGVVRGARNGKPVPAFGLDVYGHVEGQRDSRLGATSGRADDGRFEIVGLPSFPDDAAPSDVWVNARTQMSEGRSQLVPLPDRGLTDELVVRLPEPVIVGEVRFAPGPEEGQEPYVHALLLDSPDRLSLLRNAGPLIMDKDKADIPTVTLSKDKVRGHEPNAFQFDMVDPPSEPVWLAVVAQGYRNEVVGPLLVPTTGDPIRVDVVLVPGGQLLATVRLPAGQLSINVSVEGHVYPLADGQAASHSLQEYQLDWATADDVPAGGATAVLQASLTGLADGRYELVAFLGGGESGHSMRSTFDIVGGGTARVELDASPAGDTIRGHVLMPVALAGADLAVFVMQDDVSALKPRALSYALAAPDGHFEVQAVPAEDCLLAAITRGSDDSAFAFGAQLLPSRQARGEDIMVDLRQPEIVIAAAGTEHLTVSGSTGMRSIDTFIARGEMFVDVEPNHQGRLFGLPPGRYELRRQNGSCAASFTVAAADSLIRVVIP